MSSSARKTRRAAARTASKEVANGAVAAAPAQVVDIRRLAQHLADSKTAPKSGQLTPQPSIQWAQGNNSVQYTELTFDRLIEIIKTAEWGLTPDWVDLTRRMLKSDDHLASVWETRIAPIAAARWDLEPGKTRNPALTEAAQRLTDGCREALDGIDDFADVRLALLDAIATNISHVEIIWGRGSLLGIPATVPVALIPVHPRRFAFDLYYRCGLWDDGRAVAELGRAGYSVDVGYGRNVALLPPNKYIVHQPMTVFDFPTSRGLFFSVARQWWVKQWVTKYWLQGAEAGANPRTVGNVPQETVGDDVVDDLKAALESIAADGVAITRNGTTIDWKEGVAESSARVWHELYDAMNDAMSKRILGSTLNVQIGDTGGAYAAADSQAATTILPRQLIDSEQLWHSIERDLFTAIRDFNPHLFPPNTPVPNGHSVLAEEHVEVDELAVRAKCVTNDELRSTRKLPEWGGARGEAIAVLDAPTAPEVAAPPSPFANRLPPWEQARQLTSTVRTGISLPWPKVSRRSRSRRSASRPT